MRVATKRRSSSGALAIENVRMFPSASVSGGSMSVRLMYWPALKVKAPGFSNRKASVRSATSIRSRSFTREVRMAALLFPAADNRRGCMVCQKDYRAAQTTWSCRDWRHRRAQRPSRFIQVAFEADPRVRAIAEWLVRRLAAAAQPRLVSIDRDRAATFRDDLERSLNMVRSVVLRRDHDVAHLIPPVASGLRPLPLTRR